MAGSAINPMATVAPWELVAESYAIESEWTTAPFAEQALKLAALQPRYQVLDLAAGSGTLVSRIADRVERVCAVDFSKSMLACLRKRIRSDLRHKVDVVCADGTDLPLYDGQFHVGFSLFGLMFFPNRDAGFQELFRVLRPQGCALVSSWAPADQSTLMSLVFDALAEADPEFTRPTYDPESLENPERFAAEMSAAGFERVQVTPYTVSLPMMPAADLWNRLVGSSAPLSMQKQRLSDGDWQRLSARVIAHLEKYAPTPAQPLTTTAYFAIGHKPKD